MRTKKKKINKDNCLHLWEPFLCLFAIQSWVSAVDMVRWHCTHCTRRSRWSLGGPRQRTSTSRRSPHGGKWGSPSWPLSAFQPVEEWKPQADTGMIMVESVYCLLRQLLLSFFVGLFICCHLSWFWRGWGTQRQLLSLAFCRITARKCSDNKLPCRPSQNSFFFF